MKASKGKSGGAARRSENRTAELYRKYGGIIYSRCRWMLKDDAEAHDATQEVFIRVMTHLDSIPSKAALAWIYRISTNYCLNLIRARTLHAAPVARVPDRCSDHPEGQIIDRELALQLVSRSPEKLSTPAVLYYVEGFEQTQIAHALGLSRRTVINRLNDFLRSSRKFLQADEGEPATH